MVMEFHAYLAGPDVFFPDAVALGQSKKAALAAVGITGHFPFDNNIDIASFGSSRLAAYAIAQANEQLMLDCCTPGRFGFILANMMPFHGPSMDVGTAFEVGFISALAETHENLVIIGYSPDERKFEQRVIEDCYGGRDGVEQRGAALIGKKDGHMIEAFGEAENLMLTHAIAKTGGIFVRDFAAAVAFAAQKRAAFLG